MALDEHVGAQLAAIAEVMGRWPGNAWLRGGWAIDFAFGRVTRSHEDVDVFVDEKIWPAAVEVLLGAGWHPQRLDWQADLVRDDVELTLNPIRHEAGRDPRVVGGRWAGEQWPATTLTGASRGAIDGVKADYVSVESQIECKLMMPEWTGRPVRAKDLADVALLRTLPDSA